MARMTTKKRHKLTLHDRLSRLTYREACQHLGARAVELIRRGGQHDVDIDQQVSWQGGHFLLSIEGAQVDMELSDDAKRRLLFRCDACDVACEHLGAAFSLIL